MHRHVTAAIRARVTATAEIVLSVAVARSAEPRDEELTVTVDGEPVAMQEVVGPEGARLHLLPEVPPGPLELSYRATATAGGAAEEVTEIDRIRHLRPSRYADTDRLFGSVSAMFAGLEGQQLVDAVADWVHENLSYISGSSRVTDGASDTLLSRSGVCRDYAHLVIAALRARGVPARLVSVYAPGLQPMDFHAVVEALVDGRWQVVDATRMAPRPALVRIATGADAADTSFFTVHTGGVDFQRLDVTAVADGDLPTDRHDGPVAIG